MCVAHIMNTFQLPQRWRSEWGSNPDFRFTCDRSTLLRYRPDAITLVIIDEGSYH